MSEHRHPLTLAHATDAAMIRLAESLRESTAAPSWPSAIDRADECRAILAASARGSRELLARVPAGLDALTAVYATMRDPELS